MKAIFNLFTKAMLCLLLALGFSTTEAMALGMTSVDEQQQGDTYVTITGTGVRLRYGPGLNYGYYTNSKGAAISPKKGEKMLLLGQAGDWYEVKYGQDVAYVFKQYAKISNGPAVAQKSNYVLVTGTGVRLRMGPGLNYDYLKWENGGARGPKKGEKLVCVGETNDWYKVRYAKGEYYIFKQYAKRVK